MTTKSIQAATLSKFKQTEIAVSISKAIDSSTFIPTASGAQIDVSIGFAGIDTLKTLFAKRLSPEPFAALKASTAFGKINVKMYPIKILKQWEVLYSWHQPTELTFGLLANYTVEQMKIVRLDPCLDLITSSTADALELTDHMVRHVCPPYARRTPVIDGSVYYVNSRSAQNNLAIYGDRKSKFRPSSSCTHIEHRMQTAASVRSAGLSSTPAISALDQDGFWQKNLRMICPRVKNSGDMTDAFIKRYPETLKKFKSRWYKNPRARLQQLIKRGYTLDSLTGSGAELLPAVVAWGWERDVMRKRKPVLMDNTPYLPSHVVCFRKSGTHD
jgi:hypothetical protein